MPDPNSKVTTHESFGMIGASRCNSNPGCTLFGSKIRHSNYITLEIRRCDHTRDLYNDWYYGIQTPLISIDMTCDQWASFLTSLNVGQGVPCTIRSVIVEHDDGTTGYKRMEDPPIEISEYDKFQGEFDDKLNSILDRCNAAKSKIESLNLPKKKTQELIRMIEGLAQSIHSDIPFIRKQFIKSMDKVSTEAKSEVEAFISSTLQSAGLAAIKSQISDGGDMLELPKPRCEKTVPGTCCEKCAIGLGLDDRDFSEIRSSTQCQRCGTVGNCFVLLG